MPNQVTGISLTLSRSMASTYAQVEEPRPPAAVAQVEFGEGLSQLLGTSTAAGLRTSFGSPLSRVSK